MLLFCGDLTIRGERMREWFAEAGYQGASLVHQWSVTSFAEQVAANRRHERRGPAGPTDEQQLRALLSGREAQVTGLVTQFFPVSEHLLTLLPGLRFVATLRSGTQNLDVAAANRRGITVHANPGRNAGVVAEFTVALMLAVCRGLAGAHHALRSGTWLAPADRARLSTLASRRVGLVGCGAVGSRVAALLRGFGCQLRAYDPYAPPPPGVAAVSSLDELLDASDLVSLHAKATPETAGLLDAGRLRRVGPDGILINTARAELVDETALVEALRAGELGGAGLDVFSAEPLPPDHPLCSLPTVTLSPHLAGSSRDAGRIAVEMLAARLARAEPYLEWNGADHG